MDNNDNNDNNNINTGTEESQFDKIVSVEISNKMKSAYIDYAMSVIVARALPDVRDGLKPVHRRILYAMDKLDLDFSKPHKKSARIVGDTMGKYHPHGDASIYDALVRLAQDFSMRYPLVDGHGNFGSIHDAHAAASRYTEAKLAKISRAMLADIDKNTVDFMDNYDGEFKEPTVLPSRIPNLLINGSNGIAVGMATNIPPHNLNEVVDALVTIINNKIDENRDTEIEEIMEHIKGPDFPTGASILGRNGIETAYRTGRGKITIRSTAEIEKAPSGKEKITITEIPYQVNKSKLIEGIADLVKEKRIEGITDLIDESDINGLKITIECKKDASAEIILNQLYKYSQLQESYSIIFLAIVNGVPRVLNLKEILRYYLEFQEEVVTRRTQFELDKALKRMHIVEGLLKALDSIDEVINIIRASRARTDAKEALMARFGFSDAQANAICEMRLIALAGLERENLENEYNDLSAKISYCNDILSDVNKLLALIRDELIEMRTQYGDARRTALLQDANEINMEDLIEDEMSVVTMSHYNYIKRIPLSTYKSQNRGGKGIIGMQTRDEDFVEKLFLSSNHSYLLFFTSMGKVYRLKTWAVPEAGRNAKGTPIINLLDQLTEGEKITSVIPVKTFDDEQFLTMVTKHGLIKRTTATAFNNIRKTGLRALNLREDDELIAAIKTEGKNDIMVVTSSGMSIRFDENILRPLGRTAAGVKAVSLDTDDFVVGANMVDDEHKVLLITQKGYGKCTESSFYRSQNRGGKGLKSYKITDKTGPIVGLEMVTDDEELIMATNTGTVIRIRVKDISTVGRIAMGVKLINLHDDVQVMSTAKISAEYVDNGEEVTEISDENVNNSDVINEVINNHDENAEVINTDNE
jgi:DNA gyrase subunit A